MGLRHLWRHGVRHDSFVLLVHRVRHLWWHLCASLCPVEGGSVREYLRSGATLHICILFADLLCVTAQNVFLNFYCEILFGQFFVQRRTPLCFQNYQRSAPAWLAVFPFVTVTYSGHHICSTSIGPGQGRHNETSLEDTSFHFGKDPRVTLAVALDGASCEKQPERYREYFHCGAIKLYAYVLSSGVQYSREFVWHGLSIPTSPPLSPFIAGLREG